MRNLIYLILGSNIDPERNLLLAMNYLKEFGKIEAVSSVWETAPIGYWDQPNFLNCASVIQTELNVNDFQTLVIRNIRAKLILTLPYSITTFVQSGIIKYQIPRY